MDTERDTTHTHLPAAVSVTLSVPITKPLRVPCPVLESSFPLLATPILPSRRLLPSGTSSPIPERKTSQRSGGSYVLGRFPNTQSSRLKRTRTVLRRSLWPQNAAPGPAHAPGVAPLCRAFSAVDAGPSISTASSLSTLSRKVGTYTSRPLRPQQGVSIVRQLKCVAQRRVHETPPVAFVSTYVLLPGPPEPLHLHGNGSAPKGPRLRPRLYVTSHPGSASFPPCPAPCGPFQVPLGSISLTNHLPPNACLQFCFWESPSTGLTNFSCKGQIIDM